MARFKNARMDEIYAAAYRHDGQAWETCSPLRVARPEDLRLPKGPPVGRRRLAVPAHLFYFVGLFRGPISCAGS